MTKKTLKKTLVLGASLNKSRFSNICINTLVEDRIPTVAVGLREGDVAGIHINTDRPLFDNIHTITLYLGPANQVQYYDYMLSLKPERIIFNPGTWNPEFVDMAKEAGIEVVDNCTLMMITGGYY